MCINDYFFGILDNLMKTPKPAKKNPKQNKLPGLPHTISLITLNTPIICNTMRTRIIGYFHFKKRVTITVTPIIFITLLSIEKKNTNSQND